MDWTVEYLEEDGIILANIIEPLYIEGIKPLCEKIVSLASQYNSHKYLIDHRGVDAVMSMQDIEIVPDIIESITVDPDAKVVVVLEPYATQKKFRFVKDVLKFSSIQIKLSYDMDEALAWLKSV